MPQLGETVSEGEVTRWLKKVGEQVSEGEPLFEVATDKVDTEVPATVSGTLAEVLIAEGSVVPVGARLAVIAQGPGGKVVAPATAAASDSTDRPDARRGTRHTLTPLVRRLLAEHGLRAEDIPGSGPGGRLTRVDVDRAVAARARRATPASPTRDATSPAGTEPAPVAADVVAVPFTRLRRQTARLMVESKATSPHTFMAVDVDYQAVERARLRPAAPGREHDGARLTYLPFIARAVIDAIADFPRVNASVGEDALLMRRQVDLAIAVDMDGEAMLAPVIVGASDQRLPALARAIRAVALRAREGRLRPEETRGGTFTISNPGPFGTTLTIPIINQPQVAILATDGVRPRPVAVGDAVSGYAIAVRPVGTLGLSFDHRAFDGAYAARFLDRVREILQTRDWTAEM
jgi:2-oxoglutarate dehydrogenase E2 component (dihydrolipoamide succinyltransferase)